jgi:hypothetical protein
VGLAGADADPLSALLFCSVPAVRHAVVNGRWLVRDGQLLHIELPALVERHRRLTRQLQSGA